MMIREGSSDLSRLKEVKVRIPVSHHIRLHSMKVLTGKQISDAVCEALDGYFEHIERQEIAARAAVEVPIEDG